MSSTREVGYWWVARPEGSEMVYWTGSEAQLFGTDATLREHEITEWIRFEGRAPKPKGSEWAAHLKVMADRKRKHETVVAALAANLIDDESTAAATLPPAYELHEDHEEHGTFQAWRRPWASPWTTDKEQAAKDAWANLRYIAAPLLLVPAAEQAVTYDFPTDWGHGKQCMCDDCCEASEDEAAPPAPDDEVLELLGVDHLDPLAAARVLGKRLVEALGFRAKHEALLNTLRGALLAEESPAVTVTQAPYDPTKGESVTIHTEQWRPGKGQTR